MNKLSLIFVFVGLAAICSGRYLPKKEHVKQTSHEWTETAKKLDWDDKQTAAVVNLMQFIQEHDIESAEMDTNTEWKQSMLDKCMELAHFDHINELNEHVGDKKWTDVKNADFTTKWDFWNDKYMTWECEQGKMMALKNMCIVVTEDAKKKQWMDDAKTAGYKEAQWKPIADLVWKIVTTNSTGEKKSILADHCAMVNDDGQMFEINENHTPNGMKWADQAGKNISMKMEFWWNVTQQAECRIAKMKAMKNVCVEFMCPVERKEIEGWAKEAGILENEIETAVDMEMRMRMVRINIQQRDMAMKNYEKFGANQYMMEPTMTKEEIAKANALENEDWVKRIHFWANKYHQTTGPDHIKCLKNMFVIIMQNKEKLKE